MSFVTFTIFRFLLLFTPQEPGTSSTEEVAELKKLLQNETCLRKAAEEEVSKLKSQLGQRTELGVCFSLEFFA